MTTSLPSQTKIHRLGRSLWRLSLATSLLLSPFSLKVVPQGEAQPDTGTLQPFLTCANVKHDAHNTSTFSTGGCPPLHLITESAASVAAGPVAGLTDQASAANNRPACSFVLPNLAPLQSTPGVSQAALGPQSELAQVGSLAASSHEQPLIVPTAVHLLITYHPRRQEVSCKPDCLWPAWHQPEIFVAPDAGIAIREGSKG